MDSAIEKLVVLVRVCGNTFAVLRRGNHVRVRKLPARPLRFVPDQSGALALVARLRHDASASGT